MSSAANWRSTPHDLSALENNLLVVEILSAAAFSFFWGIHEIMAQERRVLKGWFPENPKRSEYYARKRETMK